MDAHGARGRRVVQFAMVYIAEAHAKDEWPISEAPKEFNQHKTLLERLFAAQTLLDDCVIASELRDNCYVDPIDNSFEHLYASWPFRFWVLSQPSVLFKPMPRNSTYDLDELADYLGALMP